MTAPVLTALQIAREIRAVRPVAVRLPVGIESEGLRFCTVELACQKPHFCNRVLPATAVRLIRKTSLSTLSNVCRLRRPYLNRTAIPGQPAGPGPRSAARRSARDANRAVSRGAGGSPRPNALRAGA